MVLQRRPLFRGTASRRRSSAANERKEKILRSRSYLTIGGGTLLLLLLLLYTAITVMFATQPQNDLLRELWLVDTEAARKDLSMIFFINLDKSTDRLEALWKDFDALPDFLSSNLRLHRVPAVSTAAVEIMLGNNVVRLNEGFTLTYSKRMKNNAAGQYTFNEAACTLSHLKAIKQAYNGGHDMVLIIEDDAMLTSDFFENWKAYAEQAPDDWQILQWTTSNMAVNKRELHRRNDYWISWKPTHYAMVAYTIRREGMKRILDLTHVSDTRNGGATVDRWEFNEPNIFVADELIYHLARNAYTSTYPWIGTQDVVSTMGEHHIGNSERDLTFGRSTVLPKVLVAKSNNEVTKRSERIAIVVNCRLKDETSIVEEIQRLRLDIEVISKLHPHSRWFINVVLVDKKLKTFFDEKKSDLPSACVDLHVQINDKRFNKFLFVKEILHRLTHYDYMLLKDNDIPLAGLEWNTFLDKKADSIVAGPFYETKEELLFRANFNRMDAKRAVNFQHSAVFNYFSEDNFNKTSSISTMFLEQGLVLLRADFASWFFSQVLTEEFVNQSVDWGPDCMWCGAAYVFNRMHRIASASPCSLISINALHKDTKQIMDNKKIDKHSVKRQGEMALNIFRSNPTFSSWMDASSSVSVAISSLRELSRWCKARGMHTSYRECGIAKATSAVRHVEGSIFSSSDGSMEATSRQSNIFYIQQITQGKRNVALYQDASQSSTVVYKGLGVASSALDGNTDPYFKIGSVTATKDGECNPWWMVKLDKIYTIHSVELHNRLDSCCSERLANFTVELLTPNGNSLITMAQVEGSGKVVGAAGLILFPSGSYGSIVRVSLRSCSPLSLAEVMVYENESSTDAIEPNLLNRKVSIQIEAEPK